MKRHRVYASIVKAIREKRLKEPFSVSDFRTTCNGFADLTYKSFLHLHSKNNSADRSELFERISPGMFTLLRPIKYGL